MKLQSVLSDIRRKRLSDLKLQLLAKTCKFRVKNSSKLTIHMPILCLLPVIGRGGGGCLLQTSNGLLISQQGQEGPLDL